MLSMGIIGASLITLVQVATANDPYAILLTDEVKDGDSTSYYLFDARGALLHVDYLRDEAKVLARFPLDKFEPHVLLFGYMIPGEDRVFVWVCRGIRKQPSDHLYVWDYKSKELVYTSICIDAGGDMNFCPIARDKFSLFYFEIEPRPGKSYDTESQSYRHWYSGPDWHRSAEIDYYGISIDSCITYSPDGLHMYGTSQEVNTHGFKKVRIDTGQVAQRFDAQAPLGEDGPRFWGLKTLCENVGVFQYSEETCDTKGSSCTLIDLDQGTIKGEYHCVPSNANGRGILLRKDDDYILYDIAYDKGGVPAGLVTKNHLRPDGSVDSETLHYNPREQIFLIDDSQNPVITERKRHQIVTMGILGHIIWHAMDITHAQREQIIFDIEQETESMQGEFHNDIWGIHKTGVPVVPVRFIQKADEASPRP